MLGGTQADTTIKAIDYDSEENHLIAGISYDTSIIGTVATASNFKPFIGYLSACEYKWMVSFDSLEGYDITTAKFNNDRTLAAFSTEVKDNQLYRSILRTSDGGVVATYPKCHSSTYVAGREAAVSIAIYGPENDYRLFTADPSQSNLIFCKYTPTGG